MATLPAAFSALALCWRTHPVAATGALSGSGSLEFQFEVYRPGGYPLDGLKSWASSQAYCKGDSDGGYEPTQDHGRRTRSRRTQDPSSTAAESRRDRQARLRDLSVAWRVAR